MPYGYLGQNLPNQTKANSGVFSISDVADLEKQGKFGGSLELIEEQSITSSTASMIFSNIKENVYDVHYLTYKNFEPTTSDDRLGLRFFESGVEESASVYQFANQLCRANGTFTEPKSTGSNHIRLGTNVKNTANHTDNGYVYLYNLGNSAKYSFTTVHTTGRYYDTGDFQTEFGGGVLPQASTVDQIKLFIGNNASNNIENLQVKLYGVKQL